MPFSIGQWMPINACICIDGLSKSSFWFNEVTLKLFLMNWGIGNTNFKGT